MPMDIEITELTKFEDERGFLVEFLKGSELRNDHKLFAQIYLTTIGPGYIRGNHYHVKLHEYFTVMHGKIWLTLEDVRTKERMEMILDAADKPLRRIRLGPFTAHGLHNISHSVAVVASYATEIYNKEQVDQVPYMVLKR